MNEGANQGRAARLSGAQDGEGDKGNQEVNRRLKSVER
jgi:hypothetical protein